MSAFKNQNQNVHLKTTITLKIIRSQYSLQVGTKYEKVMTCVFAEFRGNLVDNLFRKNSANLIPNSFTCSTKFS